MRKIFGISHWLGPWQGKRKQVSILQMQYHLLTSIADPAKVIQILKWWTENLGHYFSVSCCLFVVCAPWWLFMTELSWWLFMTYVLCWMQLLEEEWKFAYLSKTVYVLDCSVPAECFPELPDTARSWVSCTVQIISQALSAWHVSDAWSIINQMIY